MLGTILLHLASILAPTLPATQQSARELVRAPGDRAPIGPGVSFAQGTPLTGPGGCAGSIEDQAKPGACLQATSVPTPGLLFPGPHLGGVNNVQSGTNSFVGGGQNNQASNGFAFFGHTTVGGGQNNIASGGWSTVGGGFSNQAGVGYAGCTVGGGSNNTAFGYYSTVAGGTNNGATFYAAIGGGRNNSAVGFRSTIAGGESNVIASDKASDSAIGGGFRNTIESSGSTIGGGSYNTVSVEQAGGATIAGGIRNDATGAVATIAGGYHNAAQGNFSFAAGRRAKANHHGTFVWGDSQNADKTSSANDQFNVYASGGARIFSNAAATAGVVLAPGGGSWSSVSDRAAKENVEPVDPRAVLARVCALPISTWNYASQDDSVRHMGPMAQDFHAAFALGVSEKLIDTVDPDGVALAAIQGLHSLVREKDGELAAKAAEIAALRRTQDELAERVARLEAHLARLETR